MECRSWDLEIQEQKESLSGKRRERSNPFGIIASAFAFLRELR